MFEIIIYTEGCNSLVLRNGEYDDMNKGESIAWVNDPLGFVHPEGPFFDP